MTLIDGNQDCIDNVGWRFHPEKAVTLGGLNYNVTEEEKKENPPSWGSIPKYVADDYDAETDSGVVNVNNIKSWNDQRIRFIGENMSEQPYSIWYKVTVQSCAKTEPPAEPEELFYDPRIDNKGRPGISSGGR